MMGKELSLQFRWQPGSGCTSSAFPMLTSLIAHLPLLLRFLLVFVVGESCSSDGKLLCRVGQ